MLSGRARRWPWCTASFRCWSCSLPRRAGRCAQRRVRERRRARHRAATCCRGPGAAAGVCAGEGGDPVRGAAGRREGAAGHVHQGCARADCAPQTTGACLCGYGSRRLRHPTNLLGLAPDQAAGGMCKRSSNCVPVGGPGSPRARGSSHRGWRSPRRAAVPQGPVGAEPLYLMLRLRRWPAGRSRTWAWRAGPWMRIPGALACPAASAGCLSPACRAALRLPGPGAVSRPDRIRSWWACSRTDGAAVRCSADIVTPAMDN
jgi:hypothetical protein